MPKTWKTKSANIDLRDKISKELGISCFLAQLLINRGIATPEAANEFLDASLKCLHQAELLPDMSKAASRIRNALEKKERVLIFSDYDADGLTALAVLKRAFNKLGLSHEHYLNHRLKEGYGLSTQFVKYAKKTEVNLVITLDCGIANFKEIGQLHKEGIDTIIVDHHEPLEGRSPAAYAVINPKRKDSRYPCRDLAGVGLSYKLASFLLDDILEEELDLVCLGTVADVVPLIGENRVIVKEGLKKLDNTLRPGLRSLIEVAGIKNKRMTTQLISYCLGPRINACGRLDYSQPALNLLLCESGEQARGLALELQDKNIQRQRLEEQVMSEALNRLEQEIDFSKEKVIVLHQDGWHQGVLGIVAAKISDRYYRPAIVISFTDGLGKGSGRSIDNFHLLENLSECKEYLQGFGGHGRAAGLSILKKDIEAFKRRINKIASLKLKAEDLLPVLSFDLELRLEDLNNGLINDISCLEPFGQGNPKPLFLSRSLKVKSQPTVLGRDTLKFWVTDGKVTYPAVGFGMGDYLELVGQAKELELVYQLSLDNWQGNQDLQLEIEDIRATE